MTPKEIADKLNITSVQALTIQKVIRDQIDPLNFKSVQTWTNQCYNKPSIIELKLVAINEIIEGFGLEYIEHRDDTFRDTLGISYVNLGDSYINTVCYDHSLDEFVYASIGDIIEHNLYV
jgi:hypothetical protein